MTERTDELRAEFEAWAIASLKAHRNERGFWSVQLSGEDLFDAYQAGAAAEREWCAKKCDAADKSTHPAELAVAIRAMKD